jgi:isocitrate dehydrogenase (NAD+)
LKGTLFTPLSKKNTSTQSLNVQLRKDLELGVNLVHGFSMPGLELRHHDLDIVVVRFVYCNATAWWWCSVRLWISIVVC